MKENYQITIAYKAVITVEVKTEAKELGLKYFQQNRSFKGKHINLEDDYFKVEGVLNMDKTWNAL